MEPPQCFLHPSAGFIKVPRLLCFLLFRFNRLVYRLHALRYGMTGFDNGAFTHPLVVEIFQDLGGAFQGHKMLLVEVHHLRFEPYAILHWLADLRWKVRCSESMTDGTFFDLS
jgi:hypothetical protein